jgi:hypothetical protein
MAAAAGRQQERLFKRGRILLLLTGEASPIRSEADACFFQRVSGETNGLRPAG